MQEPISDNVQPAQSLNPVRDIQRVAAVDSNPDFDNMLDKVDKLELLMKQGRMDPNLIRYFPGMLPIGYQGQVYSIFTKRRFADPNYFDT